MRGRQRLERRPIEPTRTQSEMMTPPTGKRMLIGMPSGAVLVMRRTNGTVAEVMGTRTKSCLRKRRQRRRQRMKRYRRKRQRRRGEGSRTYHRRQRIFHLISRFQPTRQRREVCVRGRHTGATAAADRWRDGNTTPRRTDTRPRMAAACSRGCGCRFEKGSWCK